MTDEIIIGIVYLIILAWFISIFLDYRAKRLKHENERRMEENRHQETVEFARLINYLSRELNETAQDLENVSKNEKTTIRDM